MRASTDPRTRLQSVRDLTGSATRPLCVTDERMRQPVPTGRRSRATGRCGWWRRAGVEGGDRLFDVFSSSPQHGDLCVFSHPRPRARAPVAGAAVTASGGTGAGRRRRRGRAAGHHNESHPRRVDHAPGLPRAARPPGALEAEDAIVSPCDRSGSRRSAVQPPAGTRRLPHQPGAGGPLATGPHLSTPLGRPGRRRGAPRPAHGESAADRRVVPRRRSAATRRSADPRTRSRPTRREARGAAAEHADPRCAVAASGSARTRPATCPRTAGSRQGAPAGRLREASSQSQWTPRELGAPKEFPRTEQAPPQPARRPRRLSSGCGPGRGPGPHRPAGGASGRNVRTARYSREW